LNEDVGERVQSKRNGEKQNTRKTSVLSRGPIILSNVWYERNSQTTRQKPFEMGERVETGESICL